MKISRAVTLLVGTIVWVSSNAAWSQEVEPAVMAELGDASKMRLGVVLSPMPTGTLKAKVGPLEGEDDAAFAFGVMPTFDFGINQFLFVGLAPQFIFNVNGKDSDGDAGQELDLRARVGGIAKVADTIRLFGYVAPGYSIVMVPDKPDGQDNPAGFVLGFAAGAAFDLTPAMFLSGEVGYQVGYQGTTVSAPGGDVDVELKTNYLHLGIGLGVRL